MISASGDISVELYPLKIKLNILLQVRAIDQAGTQGPMEIMSYPDPKPSYGVSELSGETGGFAGCASTGKE